MSTKQRILNTALGMFAAKGCSAVSIRDIAYAVGIKESSIYYHFQNKQDIIDKLLADIEAQMLMMKERFAQQFEGITHVTEAAFVKVALHYRHAFFEAEPFAQFIGMLSIERYTSPQANAIYQRLLFDVPLAHQARVFQSMQEKGIFRPADAALLAQEYHYTVFGAFMGKASDRDLTALIQRLYRRESVQ